MYSNYIRHALKMRRSWMQVPWCKYATAYLPTDKETKKQTQQFLKFGDDRLEARKREGTTRADIISHLLAQDKESGGRLTELELKEEARAIIIAGSDTTSFALT
jgi:cytochrome P450